MPVALITGGSAGLGLALATALAERGWSLIIDARGTPELRSAAATLGPETIALIGDVADPAHRRELAETAAGFGALDLLVNNASSLGPSPLPALANYPLADLTAIHQVNVVAPLGLIQLTLPLLRAADGTIMNISSDAAVEPYPGWGGYGSTKAALDQITAVLAAELGPAHPGLRVYGFDPGDLRTAMHQRAFPGEDISDRPEPATVVPALLRLLDDRPPNGRYRAADLLAHSQSAS
ncbi:MAG TPA: SDR family oxidoreductase [Kineosporiaceae bacterium]|nr:SDR family oxidoreductase [Kineosporiaceae bacterium]